MPCRIIITRHEPLKQFILKEQQVISVSAMGRHISGLKASTLGPDRGDGVHGPIFPAVARELMTPSLFEDHSILDDLR